MTTKTRVVLTLEQQEEARRLVAHVLDKGGEAVLEPAQKLLLARYADTLEAVPEDVARDVALVKRRHECDPNYGCQVCTERDTAADRLATAAARVPELKVDLRRSEEALQESQVMRQSLANDVSKYVAALRTAESERDAARGAMRLACEERDAARQAAERAENAFRAANGDMCALREDLEKTTKSRDNVREARDSAQVALARTTTERDAIRSQVATLEVEAGALRSEVAKRRTHEAELRERVAELEAERKRLYLRVCAGEQNLRSANQTVLYANENGARAAAERDRAEARATAAEAQLAEMVRMVNEVAALRGAQPATHPAPAGLLEAVGKVLETYVTAVPVLPREHAASFEQLRAAYDAATGGVR